MDKFIEIATMLWQFAQNEEFWVFALAMLLFYLSDVIEARWKSRRRS
tara:strand:- start:198 stop:338 length:141 start_codon:yes stop_codon:yes gene_type:complete